MIRAILYISTGAVILLFVAYQLRTQGVNIRTFLILSPLILIHQFLFNSAYSIRNIPFLTLWFWATGIVSLTSLTVGVFFLKENLSVPKFIGILMILLGGFLIKRF